MSELSHEEQAFRDGVNCATEVVRKRLGNDDVLVAELAGLLTSKRDASKWRKQVRSPSKDKLGRAAYEAWGSKSALPSPFPPWRQIPSDERAAWRDVGETLYQLGYVAMRDHLVVGLRMTAESALLNAEEIKGLGMVDEGRARQLSAIQLREWAHVFAMYGELEKVNALHDQLNKLLKEARASIRKNKRKGTS